MRAFKKTRKGIALFLAVLLWTGDVHLYAQTPQQVARSQGLGEKEFSIPAELGHIEEVYRAPCSLPHALCPKIYYIQDAHDSLEAQEHIAKIIEHLVKNQGVKTVFEEGYEGKVPTDEYFGWIQDPDLKKKVAYFFLDKLRIGGAEYAHILRRGAGSIEQGEKISHAPRPKLSADFKLIGIDRLALHKKNIRVYRRAVKHQKEIAADLNAMDKELRELAKRTFSRKFQNWLRLREAYYQQKIGLVDYIKRTSRQSTDHSPQSKPWTIDRGQFPILQLLISERPEAIDVLKHINPQEILSEIKQLEQTVIKENLKEENARKLYEMMELIKGLRKLNDVEMPREEYEPLKNALQNFKTKKLAQFLARETKRPMFFSTQWEDRLKRAAEFYEIAKQRENAIEQSLASWVLSRGNKKLNAHDPRPTTHDNREAILVFGGFHKAGIKEILKRNGFSYVIITPKISKLSPRHQEYYKKLMSVGRLPFELSLNLRRADRPPTLFMIRNGQEQVRRAAKIGHQNPFMPVALWERKVRQVADLPVTGIQAHQKSRSELRKADPKLEAWGEKISQIMTLPEAQQKDPTIQLIREISENPENGAFAHHVYGVLTDFNPFNDKFILREKINAREGLRALGLYLLIKSYEAKQGEEHFQIEDLDYLNRLISAYNQQTWISILLDIPTLLYLNRSQVFLNQTQSDRNIYRANLEETLSPPPADFKETQNSLSKLDSNEIFRELSLQLMYLPPTYARLAVAYHNFQQAVHLSGPYKSDTYHELEIAEKFLSYSFEELKKSITEYERQALEMGVQRLLLFLVFFAASQFGRSNNDDHKMLRLRGQPKPKVEARVWSVLGQNLNEATELLTKVSYLDPEHETKEAIFSNDHKLIAVDPLLANMHWGYYIQAEPYLLEGFSRLEVSAEALFLHPQDPKIQTNLAKIIRHLIQRQEMGDNTWMRRAPLWYEAQSRDQHQLTLLVLEEIKKVRETKVSSDRFIQREIRMPMPASSSEAKTAFIRRVVIPVGMRDGPKVASTPGEILDLEIANTCTFVVVFDPDTKKYWAQHLEQILEPNLKRVEESLRQNGINLQKAILLMAGGSPISREDFDGIKIFQKSYEDYVTFFQQRRSNALQFFERLLNVPSGEKGGRIKTITINDRNGIENKSDVPNLRLFVDVDSGLAFVFQVKTENHYALIVKLLLDADKAGRLTDEGQTQLATNLLRVVLRNHAQTEKESPIAPKDFDQVLESVMNELRISQNIKMMIREVMREGNVANEGGFSKERLQVLVQQAWRTINDYTSRSEMRAQAKPMTTNEINEHLTGSNSSNTRSEVREDKNQTASIQEDRISTIPAQLKTLRSELRSYLESAKQFLARQVLAGRPGGKTFKFENHTNAHKKIAIRLLFEGVILFSLAGYLVTTHFKTGYLFFILTASIATLMADSFTQYMDRKEIDGIQLRSLLIFFAVPNGILIRLFYEWTNPKSYWPRVFWTTGYSITAGVAIILVGFLLHYSWPGVSDSKWKEKYSWKETKRKLKQHFLLPAGINLGRQALVQLAAAASRSFLALSTGSLSQVIVAYNSNTTHFDSKKIIQAAGRRLWQSFRFFLLRKDVKKTQARSELRKSGKEFSSLDLKEYQSFLVAVDEHHFKQTISGLRVEMGYKEPWNPHHLNAFRLYAYHYAKDQMARISKKEYTFLMAHDPRPSWSAVREAVVQGFQAAALENGKTVHILDLGIVTTPMAMLAVDFFKIDGGAMITASHNEPAFNGIKFLTSHHKTADKPGPGALIGAAQLRRIKAAFRRSISDQKIYQTTFLRFSKNSDAPREMVQRVKIAQLRDVYKEFLLAQFPFLDPEKLQKLQALIDTNGGAGAGKIYESGSGHIIWILRQLGLHAEDLHSEILNSGRAHHEVEPKEDGNALRELEKDLKSQQRSVGIAFDWDADRGTLGGMTSQTVAAFNVAMILASIQAHPEKYKIKKDQKVVVIAHSTSSMRLEKIAKLFSAAGLPVSIRRVAVGEANVLKAMKEEKEKGHFVPIGVEGGNGGTIYEKALGRDGTATILLAASALADEKIYQAWYRVLGKAKLFQTRRPTLRELIASIPSTFEELNKLESPIENIPEFFSSLEQVVTYAWQGHENSGSPFYGFKKYQIHYVDGTKVTTKTPQSRSASWNLVLTDERGDLSQLEVRLSNTEPIVRFLVDTSKKSSFPRLEEWLQTVLASKTITPRSELRKQTTEEKKIKHWEEIAANNKIQNRIDLLVGEWGIPLSQMPRYQAMSLRAMINNYKMLRDLFFKHASVDPYLYFNPLHHPELLRLDLNADRYSRLLKAGEKGYLETQLIQEMQQTQSTFQGPVFERNKHPYGYELWENGAVEIRQKTVAEEILLESSKREGRKNFRNWFYKNQGTVPPIMISSFVKSRGEEFAGNLRLFDGERSEQSHKEVLLSIHPDFVETSQDKPRKIWIQAHLDSVKQKKYITLHLRPEGAPVGLAYWSDESKSFEDYQGPALNVQRHDSELLRAAAWLEEPWRQTVFQTQVMAHNNVSATKRFDLALFPDGNKLTVSSIHLNQGNIYPVQGFSFVGEQRFDIRMPLVWSRTGTVGINRKYFIQGSVPELLDPSEVYQMRIFSKDDKGRAPNPLIVRLIYQSLIHKDAKGRKISLALRSRLEKQDHQVFILFDSISQVRSTQRPIRIYSVDAKGRPRGLVWAGWFDTEKGRYLEDEQNFSPHVLTGRERYEIQTVAHAFKLSAKPKPWRMVKKELAEWIRQKLLEKPHRLEELEESFKKDLLEADSSLQSIWTLLQQKNNDFGYQIGEVGTGRFSIWQPIVFGNGNQYTFNGIRSTLKTSEDFQGQTLWGLFENGKALKFKKETKEYILKRIWNFNGQLLATSVKRAGGSYKNFIFSNLVIPQSGRAQLAIENRTVNIPGQPGEVVCGIVMNGTLERVDWFSAGSEQHFIYPRSGLIAKQTQSIQLVSGTKSIRSLSATAEEPFLTANIMRRSTSGRSELRKQEEQLDWETLRDRANASKRIYSANTKGVFVPTASEYFPALSRQVTVPQKGPFRMIDLGSGQGELLFRFALNHSNPDAELIGIEGSKVLFNESQDLNAAFQKSYPNVKAPVFKQGDFNDEQFSLLLQGADIIYYYEGGTAEVGSLAKTLTKNVKPGARVITLTNATVPVSNDRRLILSENEFRAEKVNANPLITVYTRQAAYLPSLRSELRQAIRKSESSDASLLVQIDFREWTQLDAEGQFSTAQLTELLALLIERQEMKLIINHFDISQPMAKQFQFLIDQIAGRNSGLRKHVRFITSENVIASLPTAGGRATQSQIATSSRLGETPRNDRETRVVQFFYTKQTQSDNTSGVILLRPQDLIGHTTNEAGTLTVAVSRIQRKLLSASEIKEQLPEGLLWDERRSVVFANPEAARSAAQQFDHRYYLALAASA